MTTDLGEYGSAEEPVLAPMAQPPPGPRLTRRHLVAIPLVLLLVESVVLGERVHAQGGRDADPVRVATGFFTAVQTDQAAAAAALTRLPPGVDARFTQADLRAQGGIARPMVTANVRRGDRATVTVAYTVAGFVVHSDVVLARTYTGLLRAPTWRIVGGLPVLHLRAAAFETTATVDERPVRLHRGAADVTVLPGVVQVGLPAMRPAAAEATTVSAQSDGQVVRLSAVLDPTDESALEGLIADAVVNDDPGAVVGGTEYFDIDFRLDDDATITFHGRVPVDPQFDKTTGVEVLGGYVAVSGTATDKGPGPVLDDLQIG